MAAHHRTASALSPKTGGRGNSRSAARKRSRPETIEYTLPAATRAFGEDAVTSILETSIGEFKKKFRSAPRKNLIVDRIAISVVEARPRMQRAERSPSPAKQAKQAKQAKAPNLSEDASALLLRLEQKLADPEVDLSGVDPDRIIQAVMRLVPHKGRNELAERVGPFYDTAGLISWLGISRQAINKRVHAGKLIACRTEDRVLLYPTWQFGDDGELHPELSEVIDILWTGTQDGWTIALWLVTAAEQFEGKSAKEWLLESKDSDVILQVARRDAAAWAA